VNWLLAFEKYRVHFVSLVVLASIACLAVGLSRNLISFDAFWHLKMGEDWIRNNLSPWIDHYSFTFSGQPITNPPVAFQALFYWVVSAFGEFPGFVVIRGMAFALTLITATLFLRQVSHHWLMYALILPFVTLLLQLRVLVRPELFSYVFSIIALMLYFRADGKVSARTVLPMVVLMFLWTNYHVSAVGYVIFAGFFLDCAFHQYREGAVQKVWLVWLGWGALVLLVGFVNHDWSHPLIYMNSFADEWKILINEYLPPQAFISRYPSYYLLAALAPVAAILAIRQRKFGILLVWGVLAFAAVSMQRMVTPSGIVITLLTANLLAAEGFPENLLSRDASRLSGWVSAGIVLLIGLTVVMNIGRALDIREENLGTQKRYPLAIIDYMKTQGIEGRVFNNYGLGGYLISRLSPDVKVYIDGRTEILYPVSFMKRYLAADRNLDTLKEEREKYGFNLVFRRFQRNDEELVFGLDGFGLDFVDANWALYRAESANFPLHGALLAQPACWTRDMVDGLGSERTLAREILPADSALLPFMDFVAGYARAEDGAGYFDASRDPERWTDQMRRFAAFRMMEHSRYHEARVLFGAIVASQGPDYLAAAAAMMKAGEHDIAAAILRDLSSSHWKPQYAEHERFILLLYRELSRIRALEPEEAAVFDRLKRRVEGRYQSTGQWDRSVALLCTRPVDVAPAGIRS